MTHPLTTFSSVITLSTSRTADPASAGIDRFVGLEHIEPENLHIRSWGNVADGTTFTNTFKRGQVLFGKRRAYQRKVAVADFDGVCSSDIYVFESKDPNVLLPELVPFICQSEGFYDYAVKTSAGSLSPRTNWSHLANYEFPLPPVDEQRRIADLLWAADDSITLHQDLFENSQQLKKSYLANVFQKGINHTKFKDTIFGKLPESWQILTVGEVCEFLDNVRVPLSSTERAKRKGVYPYYGASGIIDHVDGYLFDEPLILLGEDGANIIDRSTPLAFKVSGKIWVNNHAHVLRVKEGFEIDYVVEYLESISYAKYKTGTAQPKLNKENVSGIPLPVPPVDEQKEIAKNINALIETQENLSSHIESLKTLKKSILSKTFSG
jgi:type I restriction enzyme S subunit